MIISKEPSHLSSSISSGSRLLTSYTRVDPAQEIARLRHSISLLESHLFPNQRNNVSVPQRRASDAAFIVPKKELIDQDVGEKNGAAPGMLGSQVQGGLYAGPTSAAMHLLIVSNPLFGGGSSANSY